MKLLFLAFLIVSKADTNCNRVRRQLYPDSVSCAKTRTCSANYACFVGSDLTPDDCSQYTCYSREEGCPEGFTYTSFLPSINSNPSQPGSTREAGYYCAPDNSTELDQGFHCHYDPENNFKLTINVAVEDIDKNNTRYDYREVSLISAAKFAEQDPNLPYVNIFNSVEDQCVGVKENGLVVFRDIVASDKCKFTAGNEIDDAGVLWYTTSFVVGYDDLTDTDPWGNEAIFRYGRNWNLVCRIKASDTLYVQPGAEGDRDEITAIKDAEVEFDMKIYTDDTFETEFDGPVDIGVLSKEDQAVYVKAWGAYESEEYAFHFEKCEITQYIEDTRNTTDPKDKIRQYATPAPMISNGCLIGYDSSFINNYFDQKDRRHEWTDEKVKTINNDQFEAFLWDAQAVYGQLADYERFFYRFECEVLLCEIDAFKRTPEDKSAVCSLNPKCANRYDNLFTQNGRKRRSSLKTDGKYGKSNVQRFTKDLYVSGSSPTLLSATLLFISALLFH